MFYVNSDFYKTLFVTDNFYKTWPTIFNKIQLKKFVKCFLSKLYRKKQSHNVLEDFFLSHFDRICFLVFVYYNLYKIFVTLIKFYYVF